MLTSASFFVIVIGAAGLGLAYAVAMSVRFLAAARKASKGQTPEESQQLAALAAAIKESRRAPLITCVLLAPFLAAMTVPSAPPFTPGYRIGVGFLAGWALALLLTAVLRVHSFFPAPDPAVLTARGLSLLDLATGQAGGQVAAILLVVTTLHVNYRNDPSSPMIGLVLGLLFVLFVLAATQESTIPPGNHEGPHAAFTGCEARALLGLCLIAATVALGTAIAVPHRPGFPLLFREWWWLPGAYAATLIVDLLATAVLQAMTRKPAPLLISVVTVGVPAVLIGSRLGSAFQQSYPALIGLVTGVLVDFLGRSGSSSSRSSVRIQMGILSAIVTLGAIMVAFRLQHGFGVALCAVGFLPAVARSVIAEMLAMRTIVASGSSASQSVSSSSLSFLCVTLPLLVVWFRLYFERYSAVADPDLDRHYAFIGLQFGLLAPLALATVFLSVRERASAATAVDSHESHGRPAIAPLAAALGVGLACVVAPLMTMILWGHQAVFGLLAGVAGAAVVAISLSGVLSQHFGSVGLIAVLLSLPAAAVPFTRLVAPFEQLTRPTKVGILSGVVVIFIVLMTVMTRGKESDK